jgi:3-phenylpropionate/cinnamic acid dioxygenase small subunit
LCARGDDARVNEIRDLLHAYCRAADRNDADALAACFTEDCLCDYGPGAPPERGREARRAAAARDLALFSATSHLLGNIAIELELDDRARVQSVVHAWHRPVGGGTWILYAEYHDLVVRTPAGWLIAERRLLVAGADGFPPDWTFHPLQRGQSPL